MFVYFQYVDVAGVFLIRLCSMLWARRPSDTRYAAVDDAAAAAGCSYFVIPCKMHSQHASRCECIACARIRKKAAHSAKRMQMKSMHATEMHSGRERKKGTYWLNTGLALEFAYEREHLLETEIFESS